MPPELLLAAVRRFFRELERNLTVTTGRLTTAYARTLDNLQPVVADFNQAVNEIAGEDDTPTPREVERLPEFDALESATVAEMNRFAGVVDNEITLLVAAALLLGTQAARTKILASVPEGIDLDDALISPPQTALDALGAILTGPAMQSKLAAFGVNAAQAITETVLKGFAAGKNPRTVARELANALNVPYAWAENMTRTAHLWSYRSANHLFYQQNPDIVTGWMWWSAQDTRTCISCWSQHGKQFTLDEGPLNDHHRGRCDELPIVVGTTWANSVIPGPQVFAGLSEAEQRQIMRTPSMFDAWQAGAVDWDQFSQPYQDDVYGEMLRAASLISILGQDAQQYYVR